ncbi:hypothetical protein FQR65_LT16178 [Abscondita terminalis]|nr:hypothetical protein FQR65_LT16178 [Abscondita terminalis]
MTFTFQEERHSSVGFPRTMLHKELLITLWYLGNLECFRSVADRFGVSKSTAWEIVYRMCKLLLKLWNTSFLEGNAYKDDSSYWENLDNVAYFQDLPQIETENNIVVPEDDINLSNDLIDQLISAVPDPLQDDNNNGITHYLTIKHLFMQNVRP